MCGIAGIIQTSPRFGVVHLQRMTDALAHRGPDGEGHWCRQDQQVMLGHRRLAVIDLSDKAAQPMHFPALSSEASHPQYSIIHNGEIYNYIELRKELSNEGYRFHTGSDTEVILAAYDYWQEECVEYFDGMFAFAIWDHQREELFAARDRFGEKPFYFSHDQNRFLFASEMKALWAAGIQRDVNLRMLFNYITIGYTDNPSRPGETFFNGIEKLPAGSRLFYSHRTQSVEIERYWDIDTDEQDTRISTADAQEKFGALLAASVKRRLRSDVALGSSLSGGLDSSSIAAMAHQYIKDPQLFHSFTAHFPGFDKDESQVAAQVASRFQLNHHLVTLSGAHLADEWRRMARAQEEPVGSSSAFAQFKTMEAAALQGTTVLLDGQGADEILAGYGKYYKWYWQELFQKRKLMKSGEIKKARELGVMETFGVRNIAAALFPELAAVILERQYLVNALRQEHLHPEFVRKQSRMAYYAGPEIRNLNGQLYFNTCVHGLEELLRYADRNAMHHGRELRLPFLDHKLVEFVFRLPASFKIRDGWTKWLLRSTMQDKLPQEIVWRKDKIGFEPPQKEWMRDPGMRQLQEAAREELVKRKILLPSALEIKETASNAYDAKAFDWRYLAAGELFL